MVEPPGPRYVVTGYGVGRAHEQAGGALRTLCGRQLRDGIPDLTAAELAERFPGTCVCSTCERIARTR